jgi:DNA topoisomerase-1
MKLVVVESPAKCRKIEGFLGKDFRVVASNGHFRDLPSKGLGLRLDTMEAEYVITKDDVAQRLKNLAHRADEVFLATDPDREGEAISWHIAEILPAGKPLQRATFQEITKKAVTRAIQSPSELNLGLVDAQRARRILDRIVGYKLSPELWKAFAGAKGLSAGRVQSAATRLVVDREREIEAFVEKVSYKVVAKLSKEGQAFIAELKFMLEGEKRKRAQFQLKEKAEEALNSMKAGPWVVQTVSHKTQQVKPQAPFTTSNLQAKAAHQLKMSASKSMQVAQKLYESGAITYHRTDSVAISAEAQKASRDLIAERFGADYVPSRAPKYKSSGSAQEAHECIRPTSITKDHLNNLGSDEQRLYRLIWEQFISSQMSPGKDAVTVVEIRSGQGIFEARGRMEVFDGYRVLNRGEVQEKSIKKKEQDNLEKQKLPKLTKDDTCEGCGMNVKEVKTRPPARFSEASLIKKLEKEGIGRPSTYATILATIVKRDYVRLERRKYMATDRGKEVTDFLVQRFPKVMELGFTRACEDRLDRIASGDMAFKAFLLRFWSYLREQIDACPQAPAKELAVERPSKRSLACPECQKQLSLEPSEKWPGRTFWCCHSCRCFLECDPTGQPLDGAQWLGR